MYAKKMKNYAVQLTKHAGNTRRVLLSFMLSIGNTSQRATDIGTALDTIMGNIKDQDRSLLFGTLGVGVSRSKHHRDQAVRRGRHHMKKVPRFKRQICSACTG